MIDAAYLKTRRTAISMAANQKGRGRLIGRTKVSMNTKSHPICNSLGRMLNLMVTG
jgi:hypothetical protein